MIKRYRNELINNVHIYLQTTDNVHVHDMHVHVHDIHVHVHDIHIHVDGHIYNLLVL